MRWYYNIQGEQIKVLLGSSIPDGQLLAEDTTQDCECSHWGQAWDSAGFIISASKRCEHGIVVLDNPPVLALQNLEELIGEIIKGSPPRDPLVRLVWDLNRSFYQDRITNNVCEESDEK